jgi:hypothetical protein
MTAPRARATSRVQLGEQSFGETSNGRLATPEQEPVASNHRHYVITLGRASAAMLTIPTG